MLCSISSGIILGEIDHFSVLPSQSSAQRAILPSIKPDRKRAAKWSARRRGRGRSGRNYDMDGMTMLRVIADVTFAKIDFFLQQNVDNNHLSHKKVFEQKREKRWQLVVYWVQDVLRRSDKMDRTLWVTPQVSSQQDLMPTSNLQGIKISQLQLPTTSPRIN